MNSAVLKYNDNTLVLSHERKEKSTMDIYPSNHLLTYVKEGLLVIRQGNKTRQIGTGQFALFKKFTQATITKTWYNGRGNFSSFVFTFHEDLVQQVLLQIDIPEESKENNPADEILLISSNPLLEQFIRSLHVFFDEDISMDPTLARLKTMEAIVAMLRTNPSMITALQNFSKRSKADLHRYMNAHFLESRKLEEFARDTGRSLSVFKKDFQEIYRTSPAKWIKQKRLEYALKLMKTTHKKASEIYLECGFEDLAHFSRSFKQQFRINPSEVVPS